MLSSTCKRDPLVASCVSCTSLSSWSLTMDEEVDPDNENVNSVLVQESSQLFQILSQQSPSVIMELCKMIPSDSGWQKQLASTAAGMTEHIAAMLEYFRAALAADCRNFLQSVCLLCENMPMHLESRLMSVAGYSSMDAVQSPAIEFETNMNTGGYEDSSSSITYENSSPPEQLIKRPRIDYWEQYIAAVRRLMLRRWERLTECLVTEIQLESVWVSLRTAKGGRDRPDQTPGSTDRGSRTPEPDGVSLESRLTLETFLQGCAGKVTVLVGPAGSGKTLLMSCLGQQWAKGLGPIPSSYMFILLEFRQLNLLSSPLSLYELLFKHYLPPKGGDDAKRAIVKYLLTNPEQCCCVLDGYDEFHHKLRKQEAQKEQLDLENPLPVADLISGLLNHQLLPGSTVLVTCRARDVVDFESMSDKVGQLLGWSRHQISEYVNNYFGKGHSANTVLGQQAVDLLHSSRHLLAMSSLPALCSICCTCLEYLLLEGRDAGGMQRGPDEGKEEEDSEGDTQREEQRTETENCEILSGTNGKAHVPARTYLAVPVTLTQVYLTVLAAMLSRDPDHGESDDKAKTTKFTQSTACMLTCLSQHHSELRELSRLAWRGLEDSKILFVEEEIPQDVLKFSIRTGLFSQVELRHQDGMLVNAYCFIHLTVQEFLAALRVMTSKDVSDMQLKKGFSLKTRWTTKSDQKTVFTDSLYLYVCGLASPHCTHVLTQLAKANGETGVQSWVQKRQALILKLLNKLCLSNTLTGPKILELCHCVQESQNNELAKQVMGARPILELRNIWLLPNDIDALAFVVNSGGNGTGLDFGACSMELECLDDLCRCQNIQYLSFRGRKYGDKFAEKLSTVLPEFTALRKLEFCSASLTAAGAASLASGLQSCPGITDINLNDNNLRDEGIRHIVEIFPKLQKLESVMMGRNNTSLKAVVCLLEKTSSCSKICHVHADGMKEVKITFSRNSRNTNSNKPKPGPTISLLNQKLTKSEVQKVGKSLTRCPALSVLNLSGGQWDEETLRTLTLFLPKMNITEKIIVNDICSSVDRLVILTALLCDCPPVRELHVRLQSPAQASIVFSGGNEKPANERSKTLCLSCCNLVPANLDRVWRSLGTSSDLTLLDLSSNFLGNKGLRKLLDILPHLNNIQEINASNNDISMEGAVMLAGALCSHNNLTQITISDGGKDQVILKFCNKSDDKQRLKTFRMTNSSLQPSHITDVCEKLIKCCSHLELEFCHSSLTDRSIKNLLKVLAKMTSLQRLNLSYSITSTTDALILISCLIDNQVTSLELRPECESIINFQEEKSDQVSCRLTHFCLNGDNMERLLEILQQVPCLSYLDLSNSQLEDEGVKHLVDFLPKLNISNYINLSNSQLSKQGLLNLSSTLCSCTSVSGVEVSLGQEKHGDEVRCLIWFMQNDVCEKTLSVKKSSLECDHLVRLAQILSSCPPLAKLELKNNLLQSEWVEDFVKLLNSSQGGCDISIEEDWISAEKAVHLVCRCLDLNRNIQTIRVHHNTLHLYLRSAELTVFSADSTDPAQSMGTEKIGFVDCAVDGYQLASIGSIIQRCPKLTQLDFALNSLGVEGAECLCSFVPMLPNLIALSLASKERSVAVAEKLSQALLQSTSIQCLILSGHIISDPAAQRLATLLPRLQSLNLSHCVWSMAGGLQLIEALAQCVILEELCLDSVQLNEESKKQLAQTLRNISLMRRLRLNEIAPTMGQSEANSMVALLAAMEGLTQIEEIELNNWGMADRGTEELTRILPVWKELRKISLSKNLISDQSGEKLLEALGSCSQLEELHLCSNHLGDLTAARIALVLPSLTHLKVLDLSENHIGNKGSVSLSNAIMCMKNLNKIHLTSVGTSELHAVVASLACCPLIKDVSLGWNNCGDEVALELAKVLPLCHKLTWIDLESNNVSALGAEALFRALRSCPALHVIRLWRNKVSESEAQSLRQRDRRLNFSPT
ncbi:protein NLRC5 isoform X2 [Parambassis ranga]|uniref:Protein NLRC5 isoform X2 n=1 Tax=Parambassis ranga TaxID=210632 RepID=A0A6P7IKJ5_9TELE|nr:protein NLRC5 isoform X2 [Parambassis ranga]